MCITIKTFILNISHITIFFNMHAICLFKIVTILSMRTTVRVYIRIFTKIVSSVLRKVVLNYSVYTCDGYPNVSRSIIFDILPINNDYIIEKYLIKRL